MIKLFLLSNYNYNIDSLEKAINACGEVKDIQITEAGRHVTRNNENINGKMRPHSSASTEYAFSIPLTACEKLDLLFTVTYELPDSDTNQADTNKQSTIEYMCKYAKECGYTCGESETAQCERYGYYKEYDAGL